MYDVPTQTVNKLSGELSSAFVDAAESNTKEKREAISASNIVETKVPQPDGFSSRIDTDFEEPGDLASTASELEESKVPIIDPMAEDLESEASEQFESFVDVSGLPVHPQGDLSVSANTLYGGVIMSEGYSKTSANQR